jgi:hypothetical protein
MRILTRRSDSPTAADGQATFAPTLTERGRAEFPSNTWSSSPTTSLTINPPPPRPHPRIASSTSALSEADDGFEDLGTDLDMFDSSGEEEEEPHQTIVAAPGPPPDKGLEPGGSGVAGNPYGRGLLVASSSQTTFESHQPLTRPTSSMPANRIKEPSEDDSDLGRKTAPSFMQRLMNEALPDLAAHGRQTEENERSPATKRPKERSSIRDASWTELEYRAPMNVRVLRGGFPIVFLGYIHVLPGTTVREIWERVLELPCYAPSSLRLYVNGSPILDGQTVRTLGFEKNRPTIIAMW